MPSLVLAVGSDHGVGMDVQSVEPSSEAKL